MKIYLGRHGETKWNITNLVQGSCNIELNENGIALAQKTAAGMKAAGIVFDRAYTSPLKRAFDTAAFIYEETGARDAEGNLIHPLIADARLKEFDFGAAEGTSFSNVKDDPSAPMHRFLYGPAGTTWPEGGETFEEVRARIIDFFEKVLMPLEGTCENILLLAHGGVNREALDWIQNRPRQGYMKTSSDFRNCSFQILDMKDGKITVCEMGRTYY